MNNMKILMCYTHNRMGGKWEEKEEARVRKRVAALYGTYATQFFEVIALANKA